MADPKKPVFFVLKNEFAAVEIRLDTDARGDRLLISDLESMRRVYLDPLQAQGLVKLSDEAIMALVRPL